MWPGMHTSRVVVCLLFACLVLPACAGSGLHQEPATPPGFAKSRVESAPELRSVAGSPELRIEGGPAQVVSAEADGLVVADADGSHARRLDAGFDRSGFALAVAARGLHAEGDELHWEWLAALSRIPEAQLSVLSIHDADGLLVHEEVLRESCASVAWSALETPELTVGCEERAWRYQPGPAQEPILTRAAFERSGAAFGPLSFGDGPVRVSAALRLQGAECRNERCTLWAVHMDDRDFMLAPQYENQQLERVTLFGPRRTRPQWWTKVRGDWNALATRYGGDGAAKEVAFPSVNALAAQPLREGWTFAETHRPQRPDMQMVIGVYRNETEQGSSFGAIAILAPPATAPATAATPAGAGEAAPAAAAAD